MDERNDIAVGIDLGTTYSVVAVCRRGQVHIIVNDSGLRTIPSVVGFAEGRRYVGDAAKELPAGSRLYDAKRLIGRSWEDQVIQNDVQRWPFRVINYGGSPRYEIGSGECFQIISPEEVSAMVLAHLKDAAETFLGTTVNKAVVTVPAYFNERQREATKCAGRIAGLDVIGMINEPTAAAMAYGFHRQTSKRTIFVYDLGGGTFDVSVLAVEGKSFTVLSSDGDTHLGGRDFDERLVDFFVENISSELQMDVKGDLELMEELRTKCELSKRKLSSLPEVSVSVFLSRKNLGYNGSISRALFEDLCADLFERTIEISKRVIHEAKLKTTDVDEVLLVGGSTRIPKVRQLLHSLFGGKELQKSVNADEAVASGAAVHAAALGGDRFVSSIKLKEVTALSLGKSVIGDRFEVLIPRNTPIPCKRSKTFSTTFDDQVYVSSKIYQGERPLCKDNIFLNKEYTITVPPRPAGEVKIDTTFALDADGLLTVTCVERSQGEKQVVSIHHSDTQLSDSEIEEVLRRARLYKQEDEEEKRKIEERLRNENFLI